MELFKDRLNIKKLIRLKYFQTTDHISLNFEEINKYSDG